MATQRSRRLRVLLSGCTLEASSSVLVTTRLLCSRSMCMRRYARNRGCALSLCMMRADSRSIMMGGPAGHMAKAPWACIFRTGTLSVAGSLHLRPATPDGRTSTGLTIS